MTAAQREALAQRKQLLGSRAELERLQITVALHDLRAIVSPAVAESGRGRSRAAMLAAAIVGVGVPLFGRSKLSRVLQLGSMAMTAWRVSRNWR